MATALDFIDRSTEAFREALVEQLHDYPVPESDPVAAGRRAAASVTAGEAWSAANGPFTHTAGAAAALGGVTKQAISQRVASGSVLGLRLAAPAGGHDRLVFPTWQFHPTVLRHLGEVLPSAGFDPQRPVTGWTVAAWLCSPDGELGEMSPLELLRAGQIDAVIRAAADVAESLGVFERREVGGA